MGGSSKVFCQRLERRMGDIDRPSVLPKGKEKSSPFRILAFLPFLFLPLPRCVARCGFFSALGHQQCPTKGPSFHLIISLQRQLVSQSTKKPVDISRFFDTKESAGVTRKIVCIIYWLGAGSVPLLFLYVRPVFFPPRRDIDCLFVPSSSLFLFFRGAMLGISASAGFFSLFPPPQGTKAG